MPFAGGDPDELQDAATALEALSQDLTGDALTVAAQGRAAAAAAGDPGVADLVETALAAVGGAAVATASLLGGLSRGATTAGGQLVRATGGSGPR